MKTTFSLLILITVWCAAFGGEPRVQKQFHKATAHTVQGDFFWDHCTEGDTLHYLVFSYDGYRPKELGQSKSERYANVPAASSRNPKATLYAGPNKPDTDLFAASEQIYQFNKDGQVRAYSERVSLEELRSFMKSAPPEITADALLAHVNALRGQKQ
jgi:hypothetical protein